MLNIGTFQAKSYGPSAAAVVTATELHKHFDMPLASALKMASVLTIRPTKSAFELASYLNKKFELPLTTALKIADRRLSQKALYLHLKCGCQSLFNIQKIAELGHIEEIPKDIGKYQVECPLCKIAAGTKIPKGGLRD